MTASTTTAPAAAAAMPSAAAARPVGTDRPGVVDLRDDQGERHPWRRPDDPARPTSTGLAPVARQDTAPVRTAAGLQIDTDAPTATTTPDAAAGASKRAMRRAAREELPDGVLAPAGRDLTGLVSLVGCAAAAEAGYNVGSATLTLLHLPLPLAVMFPLVLESAAISCAVQDLRDRRQGIRSRALVIGTYLGLAVSAVVNAAVGWAGHQAAGLLEVLPPLVLGGLLHVHGERAVRAWQSRAVLRPAWRAEQLRQAQVDSAAEVLPLLAGDDPDGRSTVTLLRRRLASATLTPAEALLAAGWHERHARGLTDSQLRRLQIVAATVWGPDVPVAPAPAPTFSRARVAPRPASPGASPTASRGASPTASRGASLTASLTASAAPATPQPTRTVEARTAGATRKASDDEVAELIRQVRTDRPGAGERPVREALTQAGLSASAGRVRALLKTVTAHGQVMELAPAGAEQDLAPAETTTETATAGDHGA